MRPAYNALSADVPAQYAELPNLSAAIDRHAQAQGVSGKSRTGLSFVTMHALFDAVPMMEQDFSDLSPNPPADPTA